MVQKAFLLGFLLAYFTVSSIDAQKHEIHVSPAGDDKASGTQLDPVRSLQRAAELARKHAGQLPTTIYLSEGSHRLSEALILGPEDGGSKSAPVTWTSLPGERAIISGGIPVVAWKMEKNGSWSADFPEGFHGSFRSFYVNGRRATRARYPDNSFLRIKEAGKDQRTNFHMHAEDMPMVDHTEGMELVLLHDWSVTRIPVKSIDRETHLLTAVDSIGSRLNFFTLTHWEEHPRYYLENRQEFCDQAGEWYADFDQRKIFYRPHTGEDIREITGIIPVAGQLLRIEATEEQQAAYIGFKGITFEHSSWAIPETGYCGIQACMHTDRSRDAAGWSQVPAAIELNGAAHCSFDQCTIRHTGGSGIWIRRNCMECAVSKSHIHGISGNGISIGEGQDRMAGDGPWWKTRPDQVSRDNRISNSLIEACGLQFYGSVGIWCGLVAKTVIEHNEIRDLPYTGISVGWMWTPEPTPCRENTIHGNHIHHIMNKLSDGGGVYSLGLQPGSRITDNLIHDIKVNAGRAESNGMFLDEGTRQLLVADNIIYNIARSPLRFHRAKAPNMVRNNVLACGDGIPPIRYNNTLEDDIQKIDNLILRQDSESHRKELEQLIQDWFAGKKAD